MFSFLNPFYDDDSSELYYTAEFSGVNTIEWKSLWDDENYWLTFSSESMKFEGTPPEAYLDEEYHVRLTCSDGFKSASQEFKISLHDEAPNIIANIKTLQE